MPFIVNLSSTFTLRQIYTLNPVRLFTGESTVLGDFASLYDRYDPQALEKCPGFFQHQSNIAKVTYDYNKNLGSIINDYKLGKMETTDFFACMLQHFNFLIREDIQFLDIDKKRIANSSYLLTQRNRGDLLTNRDIALGLLEEAWNAVIKFSHEDLKKFESLLKIANDNNEPISLISFSNEANINYIISILQQNFPDVLYKDINISPNNPEPFIKIADNISLHVSYHQKAYKVTRSDNNPHQPIVVTTSSILQNLVQNASEENELNEIKVVSQFPDDLNEAARLGIPADNILSASSFYTDNLVTNINFNKK